MKNMTSQETYARIPDFWTDRFINAVAPELWVEVDKKTGHHVCRIDFPAELLERIRQIGKDNHVNIFRILLAGYTTLVANYSGADDLLIAVPPLRGEGSPIPGGGYIYTRIRIHDDTTVKMMLDEIHRQWQEGVAQQPINPSLFQEKFRLRGIDTTALRHLGFCYDALNERFETHDDFSLLLEVVNEAGHPGVVVTHDQQKYGIHFVHQFIQHYFFVLEQIITSGKQRVSEIQLLSAIEREKTLALSSGKIEKWEGDRTLNGLFERAVSQFPNRDAVIFGQQMINYRELDALSNRRARYLRQQFAIKPDDIVALLMPKSIDYVVWVMATLKAGGAFLPLDPDYPLQRRKYMLQNSKARVLVTIGEIGENEDLQQRETDVLLADALAFDDISADPLDAVNTASDLAYVIYTSGSTGVPKGVLVEHHAISNTVLSSLQLYGYTHEDRVLQFTSISFDVSVADIFTALSCGAATVLVDKRMQRDMPALIKYMTSVGITAGSVNPSVLKLIGESAVRFRMVNTGGESPDPALAVALAKTTRYFNSYGPTEASVCCAAYEVLPQFASTYHVPVGKPFPNMQLLILDSKGRLLPQGCQGEIGIAGEGVARGYLNSADGTAKFIAHPLDPSKTIYRTGDYGKYLRSGDLLFLGRKDDQVKIAGHRIELREIEYVIQQYLHLDIVRCVARRNKDTGAAHIVAYYTGSEEFSTDHMRCHIAPYLPDHMLPAYYIRVPYFPQDANGKLDMRSLPDPFQQAPTQHYLPAETALEKKILQLWQNALGQKRIGVKDNFFRAGGNSLLATLMLAHVHKEFGIRVNYTAFFGDPTISFIEAQVRGGTADTSFDTIAPTEVSDYYDLSFAQRRLWVLCQFEEDSIAYNMPQTYAFTGAFSVESFKATVGELIHRHESLRTVFVLIDGVPKQQILPAIPEPIEYHDLTNLSEAEQRVRLEVLYREDAHRPFNLETGPLLRFTIVVMNDQSYVLLFNIHHIINDGWSQRILEKEAGEIYNHMLAGTTHTLSYPRLQYKDYAVWNKNHFETGKLSRDERYWLEKFRDKPNGLNLPFDRPRHNIQTFNGGRIPFYLPKADVDALKEICAANEATLFMGLLALVDLILYRYTGQKDIMLGAPIAGRRHPDVHDMIGFLANTVVYRVKVDPELSFNALVSAVKEDALASYDHQEYPFDLLVEKLGLSRDLSQSPLFNVMVAHNNTEAPSNESFSDMDAAAISLDEDFSIAKFDLLFFLDEYGDYVYGELEYNSDLFDRSTAERIVRNFMTATASAVRAPEYPLYKLNTLDAAEIGKISAFELPSPIPYSFTSVHKYLEQQALLSPEAIALRFNDQQVTYQELHEKSNKLAGYLRHELNMGRGDVVGVCLQRSPEMIISILGIVKTGAAYLGVDPSYPVHRVTYMLNDSQVEYVIADGVYENLFDGFSGTSLFFQDLVQRAERCDTTFTSAESEPDDTIYVIYTSGTTGTPNGAMLSHGLLGNLMEWQLSQSGISNKGICLQFTSVNFCVSFQEIFMTLASGGTVVLIDEMDRKDIGYLKRIIEVLPVENLYLPFSYLNFLLNENQQWERGKLELKHIITAGEQLKISRGLRLFLAQHPEVKLHNHYGSSEMHVVTSHTLDSRMIEEYRIPPAGKPIANTRIVILDEHRRQVPIGVFGELYVQGAHKVLGYMNNPALNETKLVSIENFSGKFYRTGDIGRWLPNGVIELSGRKDSQLKIRGFRVELGEVETHILSFTGVTEAVVVVKKDNLQQDQLIAYVVLAEQRKEDLSKYLQERLPHFMIPHLVLLDLLPLMPNGKVDRGALPNVHLLSGAEYKAPFSNTEKVLTDIWQEILGKSDIGIADNFFELGGHSLKATQMVTRIYKRLQAKLELRTIFVNPTIESLGKAIDSSMASGNRTAVPAIQPAPPMDYHPLSHGQYRLWVLDRLEPGNVAYNMPAAYNFHGKLNVGALEKAYALLIERHEALRTVFRLIDEEPTQYILPAYLPSLRLVVEDWRDKEERSPTLGQRAAMEASFRFDLERGPLIRASLIQLTDEEFVLFLNLHHIICDGWSMSVITRDLRQLYETCCTQSSAVLTPIAFQYKDYAYWQRAHFAHSAQNVHRKFWLDLFNDGVPVLNLPLDKQRPAKRSFNGDAYTFIVAKEDVQALKAIAQNEQASLFMIVVAVVNVLLAKYCGQKDIVIGTPVAGREWLQDLEDQVGFYVNTIPLRSHIDDTIPFSEFLSQTRQNILAAFEHQSYPFDKLVNELNIAKDMSRSPVMDVLITLQEPLAERVGQPEAFMITSHQQELRISKFDLSFYFVETGEGLLAEIEYSTDLFESETIERMGSHLGQLVKAIVMKPASQILGLSLLSSEEKHVLLNEWNTPHPEFPKNKLIHSLVEEQAASGGSNIAVIYNERTWTYDALNQEANRLARCLCSKYGVKPGQTVGLFMQRSDVAIISILAILKAGAGYVPIDPDYPSARIQYVVQDAGLSHVVTIGKFREKMPVNGLTVVTVDEEKMEAFAAGNLDVVTDPGSTAYIIYTSGSTGHPKGVMVSHRNVVRLIVNEAFPYRFDAADRWILFHSMNFDVSVWEIFTALLKGSRLYIADPEVLYAHHALHQFLEQNKITVLSQVPSVFYPFSASAKEHGFTRLDSLRYILFAGEALNPVLLAWWKQNHPNCRMINMYGITETTVHTTFKEVDHDMIASGDCNIGLPMPTQWLYIVDQHQQLLPAGVVGEIAVGGYGIAKGYLNKPELTRSRFLKNPFAGDDDWIYLSGDLGKRLPNGEIIYCGRIDHQVKIRGFRIECGEIENALIRLGARQALVTTIGKAEDALLVAYITGLGESEVTALKGGLSKIVPAHMVPTYFVFMDALPTNVNGKVDRKLLPDPSATQASFIPPRTETEKQTALIWQSVLRTDRVGLHDNFFNLGGHSLNAVRILAQVSRHFNVRISLGEFFEHPELESLAQRIDNASRYIVSQIPSAGEALHYPLSNGQERMWITHHLFTANRSYNILQAYTYRAPLDITALHRAFQLISEQYEVLRTRFSIIDNEPRQIVLSPEECPVHFQYFDFSTERNPDKEAQQLMEQVSETVFDLSSPPLLHIYVARTGADEFVILLNWHHIITDEWSMTVFVKKVQQYYQDVLSNPAFTVERPRVQFKDYAVWQRHLLSGEMGVSGHAFWSSQFSDGVPILILPADHPRPNVADLKGDVIGYTLDAKVTEAIRTVAAQNDASVFVTMKAIISVLLNKYSDQDSFVVGTPSLGREHEELQDQLGFFVNTLPLMTTIQEKDSFAALLARTKREVLACYAHQYYPLDLIVSSLNVDRQANRNPLFDVMISYYYDDAKQARRPDQPQFDFSDVTTQTSKFDLSFNIVDSGGTLYVSVEYATSLFKAERIVRMIRHIEALADGVCQHPDAELQTINMLTEEEKVQLHQFSFPSDPVQADTATTLVTMLEEQLRTPERIAIRWNDVTISYQQLHERANQVAHQLISMGVVPGESRVGLILDMAVDMIFVLLGVIKSGAAYIPIDPRYPAERIRSLVAEAEPNFVLTDRSTDIVQDLVIPVIQSADLLDGNTNQALNPVTVLPTHLAYIMYTSGSTGVPKGVMIEHRHVVSLLSSWQKELEQDRYDIVYALTSYSFDASVIEMFLPLTAGKSIRVITEMADAVKFTAYDKNILINTVPSTLSALHSMSISLNNVSVIISGGEPFQAHLLRGINFQKVSVWNAYGPTETTVDCTVYRIHGDEQTIPIGKPMKNATVHILSRSMQQQPIGIPGMIYIGGQGVARGYFKNPELTEQSFLPNPFSPGDRFYRSGDIGQWLPSGDIQFLGRIDHQVKIRGFRIECGEIENALIRLGASQALVTTIGKAEDALLVAYITGLGESEVTALKGGLSKIVPAHMVPTYFVFMDALPTNANGKVDRKLLPDPSATHAPLKSESQTPTAKQENHSLTKHEELILSAWRKVLGIADIGIYDNFFQLGGHSLKAIRLMSVLQGMFPEKRLTLDEIFNYPTIHTFINRPANLKAPITWTTFNARASNRTEYYLFPPAMGVSAVYHPLAERLKHTSNVYSLVYDTQFSPESGHDLQRLIGECVDGIVALHEPGNEINILGYSFGGLLAFETVRLLELKGYHPNLVMLDATTPTPMEATTEADDEEFIREEFGMVRSYLPQADLHAFDARLRTISLLTRAYRASGSVKADLTVFPIASNRDNMMQWKTFTRGDFTLHELSGDHWKALHPANLDLIISKI